MGKRSLLLPRGLEEDQARRSASSIQISIMLVCVVVGLAGDYMRAAQAFHQGLIVAVEFPQHLGGSHELLVVVAMRCSREMWPMEWMVLPPTLRTRSAMRR